MFRRNMLPPSLRWKERRLGKSCSDYCNGVVGYVGVLHGMSTNTSTGRNDEGISWSRPKGNTKRSSWALSSPLYSLTHSLTHTHTYTDVNILHFLFHISRSNKTNKMTISDFPSRCQVMNQWSYTSIPHMSTWCVQGQAHFTASTLLCP